MANQVKGLWLVCLLVVAGVVILFVTLGQQSKPQSEQGVVLHEIFDQKPRVANASPQDSPAAAAAVQEAKLVDPVPAMAIVTSPEDGQEAGFSIQVYSFQDKARAQAALDALKGSGYQAFMIMSDLGEKGTWYRVRVGGIPDEETAQKILADIRKSYNSGFIVKPKG